MATEERGEPVVLHVYDLSQGWAARLSPSVIGRKIDGIWNTGVVVAGREWCVPVPLPTTTTTNPHLLSHTFSPLSSPPLLLDARPGFGAENYNVFLQDGRRSGRQPSG